MNLVLDLFLILLFPVLFIIISLIAQLIFDNLAGVITGLLTSAVVTIILINYVYNKNHQIEVENSLNSIYHEIKYNIRQLSEFETEAIRIKKYWSVLKDYNLALSQWEEFSTDFNKPHNEVTPIDFVAKSWISPKGVSSRQTYQDSKYLYQFLSDNAFQAFIAQGHHLKIKGCNRIGDFKEWEIISLLYKSFNEFNEITQKIEDDTSVFLGNIRNWVFHHTYPPNIQFQDLESIFFITHEGYQKIPFPLQKTSQSGFGDIPTTDPDLSIDGKSAYFEKYEYITSISNTNSTIQSIILTEEQKYLPYFIFPFDNPITFEEYIDRCNSQLITGGNIPKTRIDKYILELFQINNIDEMPPFEKWKRKMLI